MWALNSQSFFYMSINEDVLLSMLDKINSIEAAVAPQLPDINFYNKCREYIQLLQAEGRTNTAICYNRSLQRFINYSKTTDLRAINRKLINDFFEYISQTVSPDAAKAYVIDIRALFRHITKFMSNAPNPFVGLNLRRKLYRIHRYITVQELRRLAQAQNLPPLAQFARDAFIISFSLCGINICDLFAIKPPEDNILHYYRQKTTRRRDDQAEQSIRINSTAAQFAARYLAADGVHWLDWAQRSATERNLLKKINKGLKICANVLNLPPLLSTYYARHTFASIARNELHFDIFDISEALNHKPPSNSIDFVYIRPDNNKPSEIAAAVCNFIFGSSAAAAAN